MRYSASLAAAFAISSVEGAPILLINDGIGFKAVGGTYLSTDFESSLFNCFIRSTRLSFFAACLIFTKYFTIGFDAGINSIALVGNKVSFVA